MDCTLKSKEDSDCQLPKQDLVCNVPGYEMLVRLKPKRFMKCSIYQAFSSLRRENTKY